MAGYRLNEKLSLERVEGGVSGGSHCCLSRNVTDQGYLTEPVTTRHHLEELALARNGKLAFGVLVAAVSWFQMRLEERERLEKLEFDELSKSASSSAQGLSHDRGAGGPSASPGRGEHDAMTGTAAGGQPRHFAGAGSRSAARPVRRPRCICYDDGNVRSS